MDALFRLVPEDDARRRTDTPNTTLIPLSALCAGLGPQPPGPGAAGLSVPALRPAEWRPLEGWMTQAEYDARFGEAFPTAARVLREMGGDGVYVAGSAALWPLVTEVPLGRCSAARASWRPDDVDYFFVADDAERAWDLLLRASAIVIAGLRAVFRDVDARFAQGVLTVIGNVPRDGEYVYDERHQFVLRYGATMAGQLHGFDLACCCVAYDGAATRLTRLGAAAVAARAIPVIPARRSPTFEVRLARYLDRGFALVLPRLRRTYRGMRLRFSGVRFACDGGDVAHVEYVGCPVFDYDPGDGSEDGDYCDLWINVAQVSRPSPRFVTTLKNCAAVPRGGPRLSEILPPAVLENALGRPARAMAAGTFRVPALMSIYGMTAGEAATAVAAVLARGTPAGDPEDGGLGGGVVAAKLFDADDVVAPYRRRVLLRYGAQPDVLEWWIRAPPGPFTASRKPMPATDAEWYGAAFDPAAPDPAAPDPTAAPAPERPVFNDACPVCLEPLGGECAVLSCGHAMHAGFGGGCVGYLGLAAGPPMCPICRAPRWRAELRALPAVEVSPGVPAAEVSPGVPAAEVSPEVPAAEVSPEVPAAEVPPEVSAAGVTPEAPVAGASSDASAAGVIPKVPTAGAPSAAAATGAPAAF